MTNERRRIKLSKFLAYVLRHHPERYGLQLDDAGWTSLPQVLDILASLPSHRWADRSDVVDLVRHGTGDGKKRFEIEGDRIRALYGHSFDRRVQHEPVSPPERLYHGTSPKALETIRHQGLKPMGRQVVHLSRDRETAHRVGSRHASQPVVVTVRAAEAHQAGVTFYQPERGIYLSEPIPPAFLDLPETKRP